MNFAENIPPSSILYMRHFAWLDDSELFLTRLSFNFIFRPRTQKKKMSVGDRGERGSHFVYCALLSFRSSAHKKFLI